jgi:hypothetical protein
MSACRRALKECLTPPTLLEMGFFAKRNTPLILLFDPRPLFRDNRSRRHGEQEASLASVNDEVVQFVKERPGTVRIDGVASGRLLIKLV